MRPSPQNIQISVCEDKQRFVLFLSKNVDVVKAVFCLGTIMLKKFLLPVPKILFDSGVLHGNFMSEQFLHKNETYLYGLMEDTDELIILADATKKCQVTKKMKLKMRVFSGLPGFPNEDLSATFSILPGLKHDLIFGLPTLMKELTDIFIARLQAVKEGTQQESDTRNPSPPNHWRED